MRKTSSSENTSQVGLKAKPQNVVRERTGVSLIELWDAGRHREAQLLAEEMGPTDSASILGFGMVEIARGNLDAAKDYLTPLAFKEDPWADRARSTLAYAYYLSGEINEAKDLLKDVPDSFPALLLKGICESRPKYAVKILEKAGCYEVRPGLAARLHNQRAMIYRKTGELDKAIQEYEAALFCFEQDESDCLPLVINNVAGVYLDYGELETAHRYADRAISMLHGDPPHLGKALDQKAQILLAEGRLKEARLKSEQAARVLRQAGRHEWLFEALLTQAKVLRADRNENEIAILQQAAEVCEYLQRDDLLIEVLQRRSELSQSIFHSSEKLCVETAIRVCGGYRAAAARLKTTHPRIMRLAKKHGIKVEK